jgi:saccharopine dehydrogenase-like NADP-dependent oxidoreductase
LVIKTNRTIRWTCKFFLKLLPLLSGGGGDKESASAFRCDVMGKSGSEAKKICQAISGKVAKLTSVPASLFARMIVERQIETPGVYPPEGIPELDIQLLMRELNKREIRIREV